MTVFQFSWDRMAISSSCSSLRHQRTLSVTASIFIYGLWPRFMFLACSSSYKIEQQVQDGRWWWLGHAYTNQSTCHSKVWTFLESSTYTVVNMDFKQGFKKCFTWNDRHPATPGHLFTADPCCQQAAQKSLIPIFKEMTSESSLLLKKSWKSSVMRFRLLYILYVMWVMQITLTMYPYVATSEVNRSNLCLCHRGQRLSERR